MTEFDELCYAWLQSCSIDWTAWAAIGSFAAAWAATRAVRGAFKIDNNRATREAAAMRRSASPLAVVIKVELDSAFFSLMSISGILGSAIDPKQKLELLKIHATGLELSVLGQSVLELGRFSPGTGEALGFAMASVSRLRASIRRQEAEPLLADVVFDLYRNDANRCIPMVQAAIESLREYFPETLEPEKSTPSNLPQKRD